MKNNGCGIVGFGLYLPEGIRDSHELSKLTGAPVDVVEKKMGINKLYYSNHEEQTSYMAIKAAQRCLENTKIDPLDIDLIIYFGENYGDYMIYSIGPAVQNAIGAKNSCVYQEECKCCSAIPAFQQAKMYIECDPDIHTVMLVGGYRNNDRVDYSDRELSFFYNLSSAGAACIIQEGYERRQILGSACITDGSFHDSIVVPAGGTKTPITKENIDDKYLHYWRLIKPDTFRNDLGQVTYKNLIGALKKALVKSGLTLNDLDVYLPLHMNVKAHAIACEMAGVPLSKSFYLSDYGHLGQLDMLFAPYLADKAGIINPGDIVGLNTMGVSYTWGATVLKW